MLIRILAVVLALVIALGGMTLTSAPASADKLTEIHKLLKKRQKNPEWGKKDERNAQFNLGVALLAASHPKNEPDEVNAVVTRPKVTVFALANDDAGLQANEPTEGGLMTQTVWGDFRAPDAARIVIHTFGSEIDTLLAVYRGTEISNLVRVTGNDNKPLAGFGSTNSLVQFDTVANASYAVQIGSRNQAEGDISLNFFRFPSGGGLAAFLAIKGGNTTNPFNGRDYSCDISSSSSLQCESARFIVYNSMDQALTVTPSTTLGAGVTSIAPFQLAPRALKIVQFNFGPSFDRAPRTKIGNFVFTGRVGSTVVTQATGRAIIVVRPTTTIDDLVRANITPTIRTGLVNEPLTFSATITNGGAVTAIGCHFRTDLRISSDLKTSFYEVDSNGERLNADDVPVNILAGATRRFKVIVASQSARDAYHFDPGVIADCANNSRSVPALRADIDISASSFFALLPSLTVTSSTPANGVLNVPASGFAYYKFRVTNKRTSALMNVLPAYVGPFDDPPNSNFTVAICRTSLATGACLAQYASSVTYQTALDQTVGFSVRVKAPAGSPAYDPDKRRVYVNFKLADADYFHIAAPSIAVRKQ